MAADDEKSVTDDDKVRILTNFISHSPPGEFNDVLNDVRVLLNNYNVLIEEVLSAFKQYNKSLMTPVEIEGSNYKTLVTEYNELEGDRYFDDRSKQSFKLDYLTMKASDYQVWTCDPTAEPWREAMELELDGYMLNHYKNGVCSVFGKSERDGVVLTACIEDHLFQPNKFWNGCWLSQWSVSLSPHGAELSGVLKVLVHYYEDGNVQLSNSKNIKEMLMVRDTQELAKKFISCVKDAENEFQMAIEENFETMSQTVLKDLRRQFPVTRAKLDWNKVLSYDIVKDFNELRV